MSEYQNFWFVIEKQLSEECHALYTGLALYKRIQTGKQWMTGITKYLKNVFATEGFY